MLTGVSAKERPWVGGGELNLAQFLSQVPDKVFKGPQGASNGSRTRLLHFREISVDADFLPILKVDDEDGGGIGIELLVGEHGCEA